MLLLRIGVGGVGACLGGGGGGGGGACVFDLFPYLLYDCFVSGDLRFEFFQVNGVACDGDSVNCWAPVVPEVRRVIRVNGLAIVCFWFVLLLWRRPS